MAHKKQHAAKSAVKTPWVVGGVVAAAVAVGGGVAVLATSNNSSHARPQAATNSRASAAQAAEAKAQLEAQLVAALSFSPANAAVSVAPDSPVTVQTTMGTLASVQVAAAGGAPLAGTLSADGKTWQYSGSLANSATYQVSGQVEGPDGVSEPFHSTFTTLTPAAVVTNTLYPLDGEVVGVGEPIVVKFNHSITTAAARTAVLSHFTVTESAPVAGGWYWFSPYELHLRPEVYWPTGEQIAVSSDLSGWDAGDGRWGSGAVSVHFSIGDAHVATANLATHEMVVTDNGATIATYPISGGSTIYPTMNGTHIALDKESVVHMVSSTVGIPVNSPAGYNEMVYDDVHISDSGEYVHAAPWSVGSQGRTNVSHGCINVSPANALSFFNFSRIGDVIVVTGGPRPPAAGDHGVMDWTTPWSDFVPANIVSSAPPPTTTTSTTVASSGASLSSPTTSPGGTTPDSTTTSLPPASTTSTTKP